MQIRLIDRQVDMNKFREVDETFAVPGGVFTIGDLHGNFIKLLYTLITQGIIKIINPKDYLKLLSIYTKKQSTIQRKDLETFDSIIQNLEVNTHFKVRLIGDELADRGQNDYFTLLLLQKLQQEQLPMEILLSNHTGEMLRYLKGEAVVLDPSQSISLTNLITLWRKKLIKKADVTKIAINSHQPLLNLLSYHLSDDNQEITLFHHAPLPVNKIQKLAEYFNVKFDASNPINLAKSIDRINAKFKDEIKNGKIRRRLNEALSNREDNPLGYILWNRNENLNTASENQQVTFQPITVYGHTGKEGCYINTDGKILEHQISLNGLLGRPGFNQGRYLVAYQRSIPLLLDYLSSSDKISETLKEIIKKNHLPSNSNSDIKKNILEAFQSKDTDNTFEDYKAILWLLIDSPNLQRLLLDKTIFDEQSFFTICDECFKLYSTTSDNTNFSENVFKDIKNKIESEEDNEIKKNKQANFYKHFLNSLREMPNYSRDIDLLLDIGKDANDSQFFVSLSEFYFNRYFNINQTAVMNDSEPQTRESYLKTVFKLVDDPCLKRLLVNKTLFDGDSFTEICNKCFAVTSNSSSNGTKIRFQLIKDKIASNETKQENLVLFYKEFFSYLRENPIYLPEKPKYGQIIDPLLKIGNDPKNKESFLILSEYFFEDYTDSKSNNLSNLLAKIAKRLPNETDPYLSQWLRKIYIIHITDPKLRDTLSQLNQKFEQNPKLRRNNLGLNMLNKILSAYDSALNLNPNSPQEQFKECIEIVKEFENIFETQQNSASFFFNWLSSLFSIPTLYAFISGKTLMQTDSSKKVASLKQQLQSLKKPSIQTEDTSSSETPHDFT